MDTKQIIDDAKLSYLKVRINEITQMFCSDYPDLEEQSAVNKLYIIEQTLIGQKAALKDWEEVCELLCKAAFKIELEDLMTLVNSIQNLSKKPIKQ